MNVHRIKSSENNQIAESYTENFCVEGTVGAEFHHDLFPGENEVLMTMSLDPANPDFSAFNSKTGRSCQLKKLLLAHEITHLYIAGLGYEYSIVRTAMDACRCTPIPPRCRCYPRDPINYIYIIRRTTAIYYIIF